MIMETLRSLRLLTVLLVLFLVLLLCPYAKPEEGNWKLIGKSETGTLWYIDAGSIFHLSENLVSVWVKSVPDKVHAEEPAGKERTEEILKRIQEKYFGDYDHTEALWELDCSRALFRLLYFCAYDRDNETLFSAPTPDAAWSWIIPGSAGESVREAVCGLR
jgi:hypothetical protein